MKLKNYLLAGTALIALSFMAACTEEDPIANGDGTETPGNDDDGNNDENTDGGNGETTGDIIVWPADTTVNLTNHYTVPKGKSLVIKEGVKIIVSTAGVGANHVPVEFTVNGNLYCEGTAEKPILFSVPEDERTEENIFAGLWGGIVASSTCEEMLIDHTIIEYTGGQVVEGSPAAATEVYTAGDDAYPQITTNNINGHYVITNSVLRNGWSDGIYLMGGNAIIANNVFAANGYDGAEAVNVKAGCVVDVAGNVMFSPNTNGLKLSSSGQSETRDMAKIQAYNNTIINAGWRRDGDGKMTADDRVLAGSSDPKFTFGLNLNAAYKGFDLSMLFTGAAGVHRLINQEVTGYFGGDDSHPATVWLDAWTPENKDATMPRVAYDVTSPSLSSNVVSTFWLQNSSYLRMKNLQFGYTLPKNVIKSVGIENVRFYYSVENLFTIHNMLVNVDPEIGDERGSSFPLTQTHAFGVNVTF